MRFFDFVTYHIKWLETLATRLFVSGTVFSLIGMALLVHNQQGSDGESRVATFIFTTVGLGGALLISTIIYNVERPPDKVMHPRRASLSRANTDF